MLGGIDIVVSMAIRHLQGAYFTVAMGHHDDQSHQGLKDAFLTGPADNISGHQVSIQRGILLKVSHDRLKGGQVAVDVGHHSQAIGGRHRLILPKVPPLREQEGFSQVSLSHL